MTTAALRVDDARVHDEVELTTVDARPTAVVAATTTWQEFPVLWGRLLGEVWECLLYRDDVPNVEVGVLLDRPCPLTGRVTASSLPAGTAATTVHRGPFRDVGEAHDAVVRWCAAHGHRLTGVRWEIYGPHDDDPARQWTEVSWLLSREVAEHDR
jgi:effector-binding domain-containing protein